MRDILRGLRTAHTEIYAVITTFLPLILAYAGLLWSLPSTWRFLRRFAWTRYVTYGTFAAQWTAPHLVPLAAVLMLPLFWTIPRLLSFALLGPVGVREKLAFGAAMQRSRELMKGGMRLDYALAFTWLAVLVAVTELLLDVAAVVLPMPLGSKAACILLWRFLIAHVALRNRLAFRCYEKALQQEQEQRRSARVPSLEVHVDAQDK